MITIKRDYRTGCMSASTKMRVYTRARAYCDKNLPQRVTLLDDINIDVHASVSRDGSHVYVQYICTCETYEAERTLRALHVQ